MAVLKAACIMNDILVLPDNYQAKFYFTHELSHISVSCGNCGECDLCSADHFMKNLRKNIPTIDELVKFDTQLFRKPAKCYNIMPVFEKARQNNIVHHWFEFINVDQCRNILKLYCGEKRFSTKIKNGSGRFHHTVYALEQNVAPAQNAALLYNISVLKIAGMAIKSIGILPPNLVVLDCSNNMLTELPKLPDTLRVLNCHWNSIAQLGDDPNYIPAGLRILNADLNWLKRINVVHCTRLRVLLLNDNRFEVSPILPDSIEELEIKSLCRGILSITLEKLQYRYDKLYLLIHSRLIMPNIPQNLRSIEYTNNCIDEYLENPAIFAGLCSAAVQFDPGCAALLLARDKYYCAINEILNHPKLRRCIIDDFESRGRYHTFDIGAPNITRLKISYRENRTDGKLLISKAKNTALNYNIPAHVKILVLNNMLDARDFPNWPTQLSFLGLNKWPARNITSLPDSLRHLLLNNCGEIVADKLPAGLVTLFCNNTPVAGNWAESSPSANIESVQLYGNVGNLANIASPENKSIKIGGNFADENLADLLKKINFGN